MKYTIPGKTFLVGEYSALVGGSALGLATGPGFQVEFQSKENGAFPFSLQSPSGLLFIENNEMLKSVDFKLTDGFSNYGGFGKSTAEYISVKLALESKNRHFPSWLNQYKELSAKSGAKVSGFDLVIQFFGGVTYFSSKLNEFLNLEWNLKNYDFILVSTGLKIKTHEHIKELDLNKLKYFPKMSDQVISAYLGTDESHFIKALNEWSLFLEKEGFLHPEAKYLKDQLQSDPDILCVKPCGAMGADVFLILTSSEKSAFVKNKLLKLNLKVQGTSVNLISGVQSQIDKDLQSEGGSYVG